MKKAVIRTAELLKHAVSRRSDVSNEVALAFSGGVDSSIIAYLLKELGVDVKLYTLTIGERPETRQAIKCAEMLGLPLEVLSKSEEDVKSLVSKALWLIEEPDILKLEIAIPILMVAQQVSGDGLKTLFLGQGGDELFAGYRRFNEIYREHGEKGVEHEIYVNIMDSYLTNFQRDEPLLTASGVSGRYPFYDLSLVNHALSISARLNLDVAGGLRKGVLREAGKVLGLPTEICELPKRAIQYGSGVHKAIRKIAHERGLDASKFVKKEYEKLFHR